MDTIQNINDPLELLECKDINDMSKAMNKLARQHGFPYTYFAIKPTKATPCQSAFVLTNFPAPWQRSYAVHHHEIDPIALHCRRHMHPLIWNASTFATERERDFFEECCRYGLRSGIGLPVHGPQGQAGILCLASDEPVRNDTRVLASLSLLRDYLCESYVRVSRAQRTARTAPTLTPRELECLKWVMAGKTSWEVSRILACSEATINFHIYNMTRKFGVQTRGQVVMRAISEGLVAPA